MTEDEARLLWCPYSMTISRTTSVNRLFGEEMDPKASDLVERNTRCLGSGCMAWRWNRDGGPTGYCGLAGQL